MIAPANQKDLNPQSGFGIRTKSSIWKAAWLPHAIPVAFCLLAAWTAYVVFNGPSDGEPNLQVWVAIGMWAAFVSFRSHVLKQLDPADRIW